MKPIISTNIDGFLIKHQAFIKPHEAWFDRAIEKTGDKSLEKWKGAKDYFKGVDIAMEKIMPNASSEERTKQARTWFQKDVIQYIKDHPEVVFKNVANTLIKLKQKFTLALITTNTKEHINQILEAAGLTNIYDIILASSSSEKPSKANIFHEFKEKYGVPKYYFASRSKKAFEQCLKLGSLCIYTAWDELNPEVQGLANQTIRNWVEMEQLLLP